MASKLLSGSIVAPGFNGLNTQESGITLDSGWALTAFNCVIDKFGRIGARRGWSLLTSNKGTLTTGQSLKSIFEFKDIDGTITYLSAGNGKLFTGVSTLTEKKVRNSTNTADLAVTFTDDNWKIQALPEGQGVGALGYAFAAQRGNPMLVWHQYGGAGYPFIWQRLFDYGSVPAGYTGAAVDFDPNEILAAYGRIWCADLTSNKTTVFYSSLLEGESFTAAGSGILDISAVVGNNDEIVALAAHNNYLVVFCKNNIVIYSNANDVDNLQLADVVKGIGCIARDSVQAVGSDVLFLSKTGVRGLGRTIQEKSLPMRELSLNIRDDLIGWVAGEDVDNIKSTYYERDAFYLLTLPTLKQVVCFDMRGALPTGAVKVSLWDSTEHKAFCPAEDGTLLLGQINGIGKYYGFSDNNTAYRMRYYTNYFSLDAPTSLKFLKKIGVVVIGGAGQAFVIKYGFDYTTNFSSQSTALANTGTVAQYNVAEYNIGEYSGGSVSKEVAVNVGGSGKVVQLGFEADINGSPLSVQKIDIALLMGKTLI